MSEAYKSVIPRTRSSFVLAGRFHRLAGHISPKPDVLCLMDPVEKVRAWVKRRRQDLHGLEATRLTPSALGVLKDVYAVSSPVAEILDKRFDTLQDFSCGLGCVLVVSFFVQFARDSFSSRRRSERRS